MAPEITCRYCGTDPNPGESKCDTIDQARHCAWMGDSDWKRYNAVVDKARAWDAIAKARADEREACALHLEASYPGHAWLNAACAAIRSRVGGVEQP